MSKTEQHLATKVPPDKRKEPAEIYLPGPQVRARYSVSDMTLHRWLKNPSLGFPQPIYIARRRYWREAELIAWERARAGGLA